MKKTLQITLNNNTGLVLETLTISTIDYNINILKQLDDSRISLLIDIQHQQLNTFLDFTKVAPFLILYLDEKLFFSGAAFSINESESSFIIQTQYKKILLIPLNQKLEVKNLLNCKKIEIL